MENDNKDGSNLAGSLPIILLLLAAAGNLFWVSPALVSWRPSEPSAKMIEPTRDQPIRARLWEDPFSVLRSRTNSAFSTTKLKNEISQHTNGLTVLAVMVGGGPFAEDREWRLRCRFAVLSALATTNFVPDDSEHIGWWTYRQSWTNSDQSGYRNNDVPFEWFTRTINNNIGTEHHLLLLWLKEEMFEDRPLYGIADLVTNLSLNSSVPVKIIGPQSSTTLRAMWENEAATKRDDLVPIYKPRKQTSLYSASATISDWRLFREKATACSDIPRAPLQTNLSNFYNIDFHNGICTDDQTCALLVQELGYRGIDWNKPYHIALISEWDTTYGRSLPQSFTNAVPNARGTYYVSGKELGIERFTYLRGLDGQTTADAKAQDSASSDKQSDSPGKSDKQKDQKMSDLQKPEGNSQLDYIPRLASQLREKQRDWVMRGERLDAIGVLGSDVYDKLLLLQSLHQQFPDAIFFTTDLDSRLFHASQLHWTRNLIVASSFGLRLNDDFQQAIAPFRDSYQTATYLACLNALGGTNDVAGTNFARCFEIGLNGPIDLSASPAVVHPSARLNRWLADVPQLLAKIGLVAVLAWAFALVIFPSTRWVIGQFFADKFRGNLLVVGFCAVILASAVFHPAFVIGAVVVYGGSIAVRANRNDLLFKKKIATPRLARAAAVTLALLLLCGVVWIIAKDQSAASGEHFSLLDGISLWPSEIVRIIAIGLTVIFLAQARFDWWREIKATAKEFKLPHKAPIAEQWRELFEFGKWRSNISIAGWKTARTSGKIGGQKLWAEYIRRGYQPFRYARAACTTLIALLFAYSLSLFFPMPVVPHRGILAFRFDTFGLVVSAIALLVLTFYVTDATQLCAKLIENLTGTETEWSNLPVAGPVCGTVPRNHAAVTKRSALAYLNDIRLIAARTESLGTMIYYPFIIIFLLFIARNAVFAAWHWTLFLYIVFGLNVAYAFVAAFWLRRVAERARAETLKALRDRLLDVLEPDTDSNTIEHLKLCISEVENKSDGAFAPLFRQPIFKAVLMPFGGAGVITALQYLLGQ